MVPQTTALPLSYIGMKIEINICTEHGWSKGTYWAPDGSDQICYALPKDACRTEFWARQTGAPLRRGRVLLWKVVAAPGDDPGRATL